MHHRRAFVVGALFAIVAAAAGAREAGAQEAHTPDAPPPVSRIQRIYWVYDSTGYHFDPATLVVHRGDTVRFLARSGVPHDVTFDSTEMPLAAVAPLIRILARSAGVSSEDDPLSSQYVFNVGEGVNIPTDSLPPGHYSFSCSEHADLGERGQLVIEESPNARYTDYFESQGSGAPDGWSYMSIDSLVVERAECYASCPLSRLSIARSGKVDFHTSGTAAAGARKTVTVSSETAIGLFAGASSAGFFDLPTRIQGDPELCPVMATNYPTVIVALFRHGGVRRVTYDTGCLTHVVTQGLRAAPPLARFADWIARIDSAAGVTRGPH